MKPIIFSTPMVEALLNTKADVWPAEPIDDTKPFKWQTRRVVKPQPDGDFKYLITTYGETLKYKSNSGAPWEVTPTIKVPYKPGDILWVRERWHTYGVGRREGKDFCYIEYAIGDIQRFDINAVQAVYFSGKSRWRSPIFMPRAAARLFLEVKGVRVERLQDITEEDAKAEGVSPMPALALLQTRNPVFKPGGIYANGYTNFEAYRAAFYTLWEGLNAKRGYGWESNPYVWVIEFGRVSNKEAKER